MLDAQAAQLVGAKAAPETEQHQLAQSEIATLNSELATLRAQLVSATAALASEQGAHADTQRDWPQRGLELERLNQQVSGQVERLAEHAGFRQSLEEKLQHAHAALERYRTASREQREQEARRHEQQAQQLQAELRQAGQTLIVKQNEITQRNKDNARLVSEAGATAKRLRESLAHGDQVQSKLGQTLAHQARAEAERDAALARGSALESELTRARDALATITEEQAKLAAQVDLHRLRLAD